MFFLSFSTPQKKKKLRMRTQLVSKNRLKPVWTEMSLTDLEWTRREIWKNQVFKVSAVSD